MSIATLPLYEQYRATAFDEVVGQDDAVKRIHVMRKRGLVGRVFWITGDSGVGKTTIARLIAAEVSSPCATQEHDASALSVQEVRDFKRLCFTRPIDADAHAIIINEAHGLSSKVVSELQTVLEDQYVQRTSTWAFTTTNKGQQRLFDTRHDAMPFLSRAIRLQLRSTGNELQFAVRAREIAQQEGLDGQPLDRYVELARQHQRNMRAVLQAIEAGELID